MPTARLLTKENLNRKITDFLDYLAIEKVSSPLTIRNYKHYLNRFSNWWGDKKTEELTQDVIRDYRLYLSKFTDIHNHSLTKRTQSYHVIAMRSFLKYLTRHDYAVLAPEKIDLPKGEGGLIAKLDNGEMVQLEIHQHKTCVCTQDGKYIGALPDNIVAKMFNHPDLDNRFQVCIRSVDPQGVKVFIKRVG